ncbi:hypothetical protein TorRG33x02_073750 [Trema orientale]|uniref:Transmembrane protein n=1 Tax=Trema orientale TaxID=63057 RepID=A0A2P5FGV2_TREOI|nr:hypothetical protein TorRG33x02_073750 [Trema orientale]
MHRPKTCPKDIYKNSGKNPPCCDPQGRHSNESQGPIRGGTGQKRTRLLHRAIASCLGLELGKRGSPVGWAYTVWSVWALGLVWWASLFLGSHRLLFGAAFGKSDRRVSLRWEVRDPAWPDQPSS